MRPELLYQLKFISDLAEGPGGLPLFVLSDIERPENEAPRYRSRLCTWDRGLKFLTQGEAKSPKWKGGYIYFTRKVDKASQLFRLPLSGGEPEQITKFKAGVESYEPSPDGKSVALLSRGDYQAPKPDEPKVYTNWPYKFDGRGLLPARPRGLWLFSDAEPRLLAEGPEDIEELAWLPDSSGIVYVAPGSAKEKWSWLQRAYQVNLSGNKRELFGGIGPITGLEAEPAGKGLVYLAHAHEHGGGTELSLYYRPFGGEPLRLAEGSFRNSLNSDCRYGGYFQNPRFAPDGTVHLVATQQGVARLLRVTLSGEVEAVSAPDQSVAAFAFPGADPYLLCESFTSAPRLFKGAELLYDPNPDELGVVAAPQTISWTSPQGHTVSGWALLPEGAGPHPVVLYIHGGPHTAFGSALVHEFQCYRQAGLAVLYSNPRGSTGYGQAFANLNHRWGQDDEADLMGFLDYALATLPLDASRVGVAGGSYGGFMTNWLCARFPGRFRAAVTDRSICNWTSFFGASDIGPRFTYLELGAAPWQDPEVLWQKSPLRLAHQAKTPTLVVHSEQDHRCPVDQGETWYTVLLHQGVDAEFLRVPDEGHELSRSGRPDRRVRRLEAYLDWWERHLR